VGLAALVAPARLEAYRKELQTLPANVA
jgi:hypothetical protein